MTQVRAFTTIANELDEAAAEAEGASGAGPGHSNHSGPLPGEHSGERWLGTSQGWLVVDGPGSGGAAAGARAAAFSAGRRGARALGARGAGSGGKDLGQGPWARTGRVRRRVGRRGKRRVGCLRPSRDLAWRPRPSPRGRSGPAPAPAPVDRAVLRAFLRDSLLCGPVHAALYQVILQRELRTRLGLRVPRPPPAFPKVSATASAGEASPLFTGHALLPLIP